VLQAGAVASPIPNVPALPAPAPEQPKPASMSSPAVSVYPPVAESVSEDSATPTSVQETSAQSVGLVSAGDGTKTSEPALKNITGTDTNSGISFPETKKIAYAYGIKYLFVNNNNDLENKILEFLNTTETVILEVISSTQVRYPKLNAIKNKNGDFENRPFEDMEPFLSRDEFINEMIVDII
jgi:hypothetical protein